MIIIDMELSENISYFFHESECSEDAASFAELVALQQDLRNLTIPGNNEEEEEESIFLVMKDYEYNYTVKQLLLICEYYGLKCQGYKKHEIIQHILLFEQDHTHVDIVMKRKELWYYMNELKHDKIMRKFVIWDKSN